MRVYLNHIEDVARVLERKAETVALQAGKCTAENPADLRDASDGQLSTVRFVTKGPEIVVQFGAGSSVRTTDRNEAAADLVAEVYNVLHPLRSFASRHPTVSLAISPIFGILGLLVIYFLPDLWYLAFGPLAIFIFASSTEFMSANNARVVPMYYRDARDKRERRKAGTTSHVLSFLAGMAVVGVAHFLGWK